MDVILTPRFIEEEQLVAELATLGIHYLSRNIDVGPVPPHAAHQLIADLILQPSSRVRTALIALLDLHPEYDQDVPAALASLQADNQITLKCLYTAAVILQRKYWQELQSTSSGGYSILSDWFGAELGVAPSATPDEQLRGLSARHQKLTERYINWAGTYENVLHHLLKHKRSARY